MLTQKHKHHRSCSHMECDGTPFKFNPFNLRFFLFLIITLILIVAEARETPPSSSNLDDSGNSSMAANGIGNHPPPPPLPPLASNGTGKPSSAFKPGIAVVVGVLTTMFSLTFLLLLYIKHCNNSGNVNTSSVGNTGSRGVQLQALTGRKNSGIDRAVVESLPIFRFGSLMGQKEGLDCAVCLTKFEATEVLRLLPKCKHAFHVECVDTWLDAHSTCPLCRHRVDPEDILLVEDPKIIPRQNQPIPEQNNNNNEQEQQNLEMERGIRRNASPPIAEIRRVSGRHSSVGERDGGFLKMILQKEATKFGDESEREMSPTTTSFRRSLDSATATNNATRKKSENAGNGVGVGVGVGCFVRPRKDGMLLSQDADREKERDRTSVERRLEHRIIVSPSPKPHGGAHHHHHRQRWSDVQPSDLLYLTSEMIISDGRGFSRRRRHQQQQQNMMQMQVPVPVPVQVHWNTEEGRRSVQQGERSVVNDEVEDSWGIINSRSVSEITGLSRFLSNNNRNRERRHHGDEEEERRQRQERLVSRWLGWISKSQTHTQPDVR